MKDRNLKILFCVIFGGVLLALIAVLVLQSIGSQTKAQLTGDTVLTEDELLLEAPPIIDPIVEEAAITDEVGTFFQSGNLTFTTDDTVHMIIPFADANGVDFSILPDTATAAASVNVKVDGLLPSFTFYLYRDGINPNPETITTDANGSLTIPVATDGNHRIQLLESQSTYYISNSGGDCASGVIPGATWDLASKTCTLAAGATYTELISINGTDITLEGNNAILDIRGDSALTPSTAVYTRLSGNTIRNLTIHMDEFDQRGIDLYGANNTTISGINITIDSGANSGTPFLYGIVTFLANGVDISGLNIDVSGNRYINGIIAQYTSNFTLNDYEWHSEDYTGLQSMGLNVIGSGPLIPTGPYTYTNYNITNSRFYGDETNTSSITYGALIQIVDSVNIDNVEFYGAKRGLTLYRTTGGGSLTNAYCEARGECYVISSNYDGLTISHAEAKMNAPGKTQGFYGFMIGNVPWATSFDYLTVDGPKLYGIYLYQWPGSTTISNSIISNSDRYGIMVLPNQGVAGEVADVELLNNVVTNSVNDDLRCADITGGASSNCYGSGNLFSKAPNGWDGDPPPIGYQIASDADSDGVNDSVDMFPLAGSDACALSGDFALTDQGAGVYRLGSNSTVPVRFSCNGGVLQGTVSGAGGAVDVSYIPDTGVLMTLVAGTAEMSDGPATTNRIAVTFDEVGDSASLQDFASGDTVYTYYAGDATDDVTIRNDGAQTSICTHIGTSGDTVTVYTDADGFTVPTPSPGRVKCNITDAEAADATVGTTDQGPGQSNGQRRGQNSTEIKYIDGPDTTMQLDIVDHITASVVGRANMGKSQRLTLAALPGSVEIIREDTNGILIIEVIASDGSTVGTIDTNGGEDFVLSQGGGTVDITNTGTVTIEFTDSNNTTTPVIPGETYTATAGPQGAIKARVTSNYVTTMQGATGQQPLAGATVKAFNVNDSCVASYFPTADLVNANCSAANTCITDAAGECTMNVAAYNSYYVLTEEVNHKGILPSHAIGTVNEGQIKQARLSFLKTLDGDAKPGKTSKFTGSELWVYEPDYVIWDGVNEYYPFVFESDSDWTVDVCVTAPEGYQVVDGGCAEALIAGEPKSILFEMIEVGSKPDKTKVKMKIKDPMGRVFTHDSEIGVKLAPGLAKAKGLDLDKFGRIKE